MATIRELLTKWAFDVEDEKVKQFDQALFAAKRNADKIGEGLNAAADTAISFGAKLSGFVTLPLTLLAGAAIKSAAEFDTYRGVLMNVAGSAEAASEQFLRLQRLAKEPGLGLPQLVQGTAFLQELGFTAQQSERTIKIFGNALARIGKGPSELPGIVTALGRIGSATEVSSREILMITKQLPIARQALRSAFGTESVEEIQKLGLTGQQFVETLTAELGKLPRAQEPFLDQLGDLRASFSELFGEFGKGFIEMIAPIVDWAIPAVERLTDAVRLLPKPFKVAAVLAAIFLASLGPIIIAVGLIIKLHTELRIIIATVNLLNASWVAAGHASLIAQVKMIAGIALIVLAVIAVIAIFALLVEDFYYFFSGTGPSAIGRFIDWLKQANPVVQALIVAFGVLAVVLLAAFAPIYLLIPLLALIVGYWIANWDKLVKQLKLSMGFLVADIKEMWDSFVDWFLGIPDMLLSAWKSFTDWLLEKLNFIAEKLAPIRAGLSSAFDFAKGSLGIGTGEPTIGAGMLAGDMPFNAASAIAAGVVGSQGGTTTKNINVSAEIALQVPAGSSQEQTQFLKDQAARVFDERFGQIMRDTSEAHPMVEGPKR